MKDNKIDILINKNNQKIIHIKKEYTTIRELVHNIDHTFSILRGKKEKLQTIYNKLLTDNKDTLFVFGLDSFNFQNKLINVEIDSMNKFYNLISNRIFCDYYKLNKLVYKYIVENIENDKLKTKITQQNNLKIQYDYLDVYKFYDIQNTTELFTNVINMLIELLDYTTTLSKYLLNYKSEKKNGFSINNFVYTYEYKCVMIEQQIQLFLNYITFFLSNHSKFLSRFMNKLTITYQQILSDINFEDANLFKHSQVRTNNVSISSPNSNMSSEQENSTTNSIINYSTSSSDNEDNNSVINNISVQNDIINENLIRENNQIIENNEYNKTNTTKPNNKNKNEENKPNYKNILLKYQERSNSLNECKDKNNIIDSN
jgi:hypothetical protein